MGAKLDFDLTSKDFAFLNLSVKEDVSFFHNINVSILLNFELYCGNMSYVMDKMFFGITTTWKVDSLLGT